MRLLASLFFLILALHGSETFSRWEGPRHYGNSKLFVGSTTNGEEFLKTIDVLSLETIRNTLLRQEETIIFALIERAQYYQNSVVYERGGFEDMGTPLGAVAPSKTSEDATPSEISFLEYMLLGTEVLHCAARRYTSPEEHAFFPERLPTTPMDALPALDYPDDLLSNEGDASSVNFNKKLLAKYIDTIVPSLCRRGDDEQHGSTALCDIAVLQALSRRVHYGKFVAESKYRSDPDGYQRLVDAGDSEGVMALLTNAAVEEQVVRRAWLKAATYGTEPLLQELPRLKGKSTSAIVAAAAASAVVVSLEALDKDQSEKGKVDPCVIESIYRDIIIPLTKDIEVAYLFKRCGKEPPAKYMP